MGTLQQKRPHSINNVTTEKGCRTGLAFPPHRRWSIRRKGWDRPQRSKLQGKPRLRAPADGRLGTASRHWRVAKSRPLVTPSAPHTAGTTDSVASGTASSNRVPASDDPVRSRSTQRSSAGHLSLSCVLCLAEVLNAYLEALQKMSAECSKAEPFDSPATGRCTPRHWGS